MDANTKRRLNDLTEKALRDNASDEELRELSIIVAESIMGDADEEQESSSEIIEFRSRLG